jgi:hypothetical protein
MGPWHLFLKYIGVGYNGLFHMLLGVNNFVYEQKWLNVFMVFILRVEKNFIHYFLKDAKHTK